MMAAQSSSYWCGNSLRDETRMAKAVSTRRVVLSSVQRKVPKKKTQGITPFPRKSKNLPFWHRGRGRQGDCHGQYSWRATAVGSLGGASSSLGLPQKVSPCSSAQTAWTGPHGSPLVGATRLDRRVPRFGPHGLHFADLIHRLDSPPCRWHAVTHESSPCNSALPCGYHEALPIFRLPATCRLQNLSFTVLTPKRNLMNLICSPIRVISPPKRKR